MLLAGCLAVPFAAAAIGEHEEERRTFRQAELALHYGHMGRFRQLSHELRRYPLHPYLLKADLERRLTSIGSDEMRLFLYRYGDTLPGQRLRRQWLHTLARQGRWQTYAQYYVDDSDTALACHYRRAQLELDDPEAAFDGMRQLWLRGTSLPSACDPVLAAWRDHGHLEDDLVLARLRLALSANERSLARHLRDRIRDDEVRERAEQWLTLHEQPRRVVDRLAKDELDDLALAAHALSRWSRRDPEAVLNAWQEWKTRLPFTPDQRHKVEWNLARKLGHADHPQARELLQHLAGEPGGEPLARLKLALALRARSWEWVLEATEAVPAEQRRHGVWRYWRARALEGLGKGAKAENIYFNLAQETGYYAFMAADRLGLPYQLPTPEPKLVADDETLARAYPGITRALELRALGRNPDARREWNRTMEQLTPTLRADAARVAAHEGWYDRALFTALDANLSDPSVGYPLAHHEAIVRLTRNTHVDAAWVLALIRQESGFIADIRSGAGALGLMQLMPRTAASVARRLDRPHPGTRDLIEVETNLELGVHYLDTSSRRFDGHAVVATAAYNAGPTRVSRWLPRDRAMPADMWIDAMPFSETRRYVRRVMTATAIYEQRLGNEPRRLSDRMPPVAGPGAERLARRD
ncbi:MAG: transglycosylase SLT domain-containing protein [Thiohalospira sp.]